ncbi:thymidylate synthase, partial [Flavobacterium sp.]|uniref:thymidylate synthase n=1 Tax=Flavobacterium sp. TaxID=239 RepID=UPI0037BF2DB5
PEDTGSVSGQRVPCTLGYHFQMNGNQLDLVYHIRSCDYYRHLRDDIYLAMRLALWVKNHLNPEIILGEFCMFISNLHIFENEISRLTRENK